MKPIIEDFEKQSKNKKFTLNQIYSFLYYKLKGKEFDFNEISNYPQIDRSVPSRLTSRGYAISFYDVIDYRRKRYRLISPDDEAFASGLLTELRNKCNIVHFKEIPIDTLFYQILRQLKDKIQYLISGIHAFNYYIPAIIDKTYNLKIFKEDLDKFYSLFAKSNFIPLIFMENKLVNEKSMKPEPEKRYVILDCSLTKITYQYARIIEDLPVISPECLILDFLISGSEIYSILALLLTQDMNFEFLVKSAKQRDILGKLLFLIQVLEKILNKEYQFHNEIINMKPKALVSFANFPQKLDSTTDDFINILNNKQIDAIQADRTFFLELGKEWGLKSNLKRSEVMKVIEDINKESWSKLWQ